MKICGIIAEYNPFHNGHLHHINQVKKLADAVVVVMSGHVVQRGELAIYDKWTRARAALSCGADLIVELPTVFSCSSAEKFSNAAIYILQQLNCIDMINFGSESGNIDDLIKLAHICQKIDKSTAMRSHLKKGFSYPKARQLAISDPISELLEAPNNTLGVEYIKACLNLNCNFLIYTTKRHKDTDKNDQKIKFATSSFIRKNIDKISEYVPKKLLDAYISPSKLPSDLLFYKLRNMKRHEFAELPDISEGLENRLFKFSKTATTLEEFFKLVKTKRYTMSRLRRIVLCALLGIKKQNIPQNPQYARVLGFNETGEKILSISKKNDNIMITSNFKNIAKNFSYSADVDSKATNLFMFCQKKPKPCGEEYRKKPVILTD